MKSEQNTNKTKSETLSYLKPKIKKSTIEKIFVFTVKEWNDNKLEIINKISKRFTKTIVIRSSVIGEDSLESSQAGNYTSVLGIKSQSKKIFLMLLKK
jgi:glutamine kinase